ncbi:hypothetical protein J132_10896 [Termitomyces sp. J132]|nr:hypothetical protein J132_10896 [Termitomyces sp. J132]
MPPPEESSSSSSSSSSEDESEEERVVMPVSTKPRRASRSASPPSAEIPSFLSNSSGDAKAEMKAKFRKFWMESVADGFKDDLEEIRKVGVLVEYMDRTLIGRRSETWMHRGWEC